MTALVVCSVALLLVGFVTRQVRASRILDADIRALQEARRPRHGTTRGGWGW